MTDILQIEHSLIGKINDTIHEKDDFSNEILDQENKQFLNSLKEDNNKNVKLLNFVQTIVNSSKKTYNCDDKEKLCNIYENESDSIVNSKKIMKQKAISVKKKTRLTESSTGSICGKRIDGFTDEEQQYIKKLGKFFRQPIVQNKIRNMTESNRNIEYGILKFANFYGIAYTIDENGVNYYHYLPNFFDMLHDLKECGISFDYDYEARNHEKNKIQKQNDENHHEINNNGIIQVKEENENENENKNNNENNDENNDEIKRNSEEFQESTVSKNKSFYDTNTLMRIFDSHHDHVNTFKKIKFDCFRRDDNLLFYYTDCEHFNTTIGQMNFFEWYFSKNVDQFIKDHISIIKYLNKTDSQLKKKNKIQKELFSEYIDEFETHKNQFQLDDNMSNHITKKYPKQIDETEKLEQNAEEPDNFKKYTEQEQTYLTQLNDQSNALYVVTSDNENNESHTFYETISPRDNMIKHLPIPTGEQIKTRKYKRDKKLQKLTKENKVATKLRMETSKKGKKSCIQSYKTNITISFA